MEHNSFSAVLIVFFFVLGEESLKLIEDKIIKDSSSINQKRKNNLELENFMKLDLSN